MKEKKELKIFGINIWRILAYFIIYSILGFCIETIFGIITKGVYESRKSFLYGPFCGIYGLGAIFMIIVLKKFDDNKFKLFCGGFFVGSALEYILSLIGQILLNVVWWDYSDKPFNVNGRICVSFSFFWGILAVFLLDYLNPKIDKIIDKFSQKFSDRLVKKVILLIIVFLILDVLVTGFAIKMLFARLIDKNQIEVKNETVLINKLYKNEIIENITKKLFSDEKMLKTFPNLKITDINGKIIYIDSLLPEIQPYYIKLFNPKENIVREII